MQEARCRSPRVQGDCFCSFIIHHIIIVITSSLSSLIFLTATADQPLQAHHSRSAQAGHALRRSSPVDCREDAVGEQSCSLLIHTFPFLQYYDGLKWAMSQSQEESDEDEAENQAHAADADAGNEAHQKVDFGDH
jgi:hypothetical protein